MHILRLADRGNDLGVGSQFAGGKCDKHRGVIPVRGHDDRLGVLHPSQAQHIRFGGAATHGHQVGGGRSVQGHLVFVNDHDFDGAAPSESIACTAVFPLVPYPTTTVWLRTRALHRWIFSA